MATDRQYFEQLHDIAELKRYIRHLEQRLEYKGDPAYANRVRSMYLGDELAKEIDRD